MAATFNSLEYDRERNKRPDRVAARAAYAKTERGKIVARKAKAKWKLKNPVKRRAGEIVLYAIKTGKITKGSCEDCGTDKAVHGHHDDYAKPLAVRWLCSAHHNEWHKKNGEALNP